MPGIVDRLAAPEAAPVLGDDGIHRGGRTAYAGYGTDPGFRPGMYGYAGYGGMAGPASLHHNCGWRLKAERHRRSWTVS